MNRLLDTPGLADALESDRFKQILDQVPVGIVVARIIPAERIVYANLEFERLVGQTAADIAGRSWEVLSDMVRVGDERLDLGAAVVAESDHIGAFAVSRQGEPPVLLDAWSNVIEDDQGHPAFRLVALAAKDPARDGSGEELERAVMAKDFELRELQHRVKNNLQLITSLIRVEARGLANDRAGERFDLLAGRVEALAVLYRSFSAADSSGAVDLGVYLSEIASGVMRAHATEGIHLDLQVDTWPVSVNVAMPAGLVVNELLTNALKHAFRGREKGAIQLHATAEGDGCRVVVADDGVGLPEGAEWPAPGRMSALFVRSLRQNAKATVEVTSRPGEGMRVEIRFTRAAAAPASPLTP